LREPEIKGRRKAACRLVCWNLLFAYRGLLAMIRPRSIVIRDIPFSQMRLPIEAAAAFRESAGCGAIC
jgi:hypothetical protein